VLDQLRTRLRRRDIHAPGSTRWGDPRADLLTPVPGLTSVRRCATPWPSKPEPATAIGQLSATLDAAWRRTATGYVANPDLRIEHRKGRDEIVLTPVADETYPPLSRARLNWVAHNYLRSATHAAANARLVDYHTPLPLAQAWGGGEMASADPRHTA